MFLLVISAFFEINSVIYLSSPSIALEEDTFKKFIISSDFNSLSIGTTIPIIVAAKYDTAQL